MTKNKEKQDAETKALRMFSALRRVEERSIELAVDVHGLIEEAISDVPIEPFEEFIKPKPEDDSDMREVKRILAEAAGIDR